RATSHDLTPLQIMQILYCSVNNVHVDYTKLLWDELHYGLKNPSTLIPYPRFTKLIVGHYMTAFPEISQRVRDNYYNLEHDEIVKSIFNLGKNKAGKSRDDLEAKKNEEKVKEHLMVKVIEKLAEGIQNVEEAKADNSIPNSQNDPDTRLDPKSYMESPKVEKTAEVQPINVIIEEEESAEDDYELRRTKQWKNVEETRNTLLGNSMRQN
nr:hypothetical protein [Tanacetum cinerariifolium]